MSRVLLCCGLMLLAASQVGCARSLYDGLAGGGCNRIGCQGCGHRYLGAYAEDPPRPEPCDDCGNWVGHCGSCNAGGRAPWSRTRCQRTSFLQSLASEFSLGGACCEDEGCSECRETCTSCAAETDCGCAETTCGEVGCGEPGCGYTSAARAAYVEQGVVASRSPRRVVQPASHANVITAAAPQKNAGCNCGKH